MISKVSKSLSRCVISSLLGLQAVICVHADAQILSDQTLLRNSRILFDEGTFFIDEGTMVGDNLFHSFESFSIPFNSRAIFELNPSVNILVSRVTGGSPSKINGQLQVESGADFFLLNPNGITFGPNASLEVGGSFFATTAESIEFRDGYVFSAKDISDSQLLSVDVPVGLQFGQSVQKISNFSSSRNLITGNLGLGVSDNQSLNLIGGPIDFRNGFVDSTSGLVQLISVGDQSFVELAPDLSGGVIDADSIDVFSNLRVLDNSLILSRGSANGLINLIGNNISIRGGSQVISQTVGEEGDLAIRVIAKNDLEISGTASLSGPFDAGLEVLGIRVPQRSRVSSDLSFLSRGFSGDVDIQARKIEVSGGAELSVTAGGNGGGGELLIQSSESLEVFGNAPLLDIDEDRILELFAPLPVDPLFFARGFTGSIVLNSILGEGQSQDLIVKTGTLSVREGGIINAGPLGVGNAGDIEIFATDLVEIVGVDQTESFPSAITVAALPNALGIPGDLTIETPTLKIHAGARIGLDTTRDLGARGAINAPNLVEISGTSPNGTFESRISGQSSFAGIGGTVELNTERLRILDGGSIFVAGVSSSAGGDIQINASSLLLDNGASISTASSQGLGGSIRLDVEGALVLRRNSDISARAGAAGTGGNISINANLIAASPENNDIIATSFAGAGGNIGITTRGILGLQASAQLTSESDISASSELGVDGSVTINSPNTELESTQIELSEAFAPPELAAGCHTVQATEGSFVRTGRGGLPVNPISTVSVDGLWQDLEPLPSASLRSQPIAMSPTSDSSLGQPVVQSRVKEAIAWQVTKDGEVQLVTSEEAVGPNLSNAVTCSGG